MKKALLIIILSGLGTILHAQYTLIPDPYFEGVLVGTGIDTDGEINGQVLTSDITGVTQLFIFDQQEITDVTGIEDFISLEQLELTNMGITHLDLSNAINLKDLEVGNNELEELDLSNNVNLETFIMQLNCASCNFTSPLNTLDLTNNPLLNFLGLFDTPIEQIDLSNNSNLSYLELTRNNSMFNVNLRSGNNLSINFLQFQFNSNLQCIQVDDPAAVIAGVDPPYDNWFIDGSPTITDDCQLGMEDFLNDKVSIYPNPFDEVVYIESDSSVAIESLKIYSILGQLILEKEDNFNQIDVSKLKSGVYFLKLSTTSGNLTKKLVKK